MHLCVVQIFSFNQKPAEDEDNDEEDLSDSSDSVFSGLEDSGSDSDDDEEEEEQGSDDEDGVKADSKQGEQVRLSLDCGVSPGSPSAPLMFHSAHRRREEDRRQEEKRRMSMSTTLQMRR